MPDYHWFMLDWNRQPCVINGFGKRILSKKSLRVLNALSKDMRHIYDEVFFYYDHGPCVEDRRGKYMAVEDILGSKYFGLSEKIRGMIKEQFVDSYEAYRNINEKIKD